MDRIYETRRYSRSDDALDSLDILYHQLGKNLAIEDAYITKFVNIMIPFTGVHNDFHNDLKAGKILSDIVDAMNGVISFDEVESKFTLMDKQGAFEPDIEQKLKTVIQYMKKVYDKLEYTSCYLYKGVIDVGDDDKVLKTKGSDAIFDAMGFCLEECSPARAYGQVHSSKY